MQKGPVSQLHGTTGDLGGRAGRWLGCRVVGMLLRIWPRIARGWGFGLRWCRWMVGRCRRDFLDGLCRLGRFLRYLVLVRVEGEGEGD